MAYHETFQCLTERATMQLHDLADFLKAIKPFVDESKNYNMDEYHMINLSLPVSLYSHLSSLEQLSNDCISLSL